MRRAAGSGFATTLAALAKKPWQTQGQITKLLGYHAARTLQRLRERGLVRRRVGDQPFQKYEYAKVEGT